MRNRQREDDILDSISELVDEQLAHGPRDDYNRDYLARIDQGEVRAERCDRCGGEFHGLPRGRCPGTMSTDEAVEWVQRRQHSEVLVSGTAANPIYSPWTISEGEYILPAGSVVGHVCRIEVNEDGVIRCADCGATVTTPSEPMYPRLSPQHPYVREPRREINWSVNICDHSTLDFAEGEQPVCHDCGITVVGDPTTDSGHFTITIPEGPPMIPGVDVHLGGRERAWLTEMVEATEEYVQDQIETVTGVRGYTLDDLWRMREEMWRHRYPQPTVRLWDSEFNHIATVQPEPVEPVHLGTRITNVRFYGVVTDADNPEPMTATLELTNPDEATLTLRAYTWLPGDEESQFTFNEDAATLEITASGDGYVPVGTIVGDGPEIQSDCTDLVPWGGETVSTTFSDETPPARALRAIAAANEFAQTLLESEDVL